MHISIKSRTFAEVFIFELDFMLWSAPLAVIARGVLLSICLKKLSILRKINFFFEKIVEKIW